MSQTPDESNILLKIGEVTFPRTLRFVPSENFIIDTSDGTKVKISYLGKNFPVWFLDKIETDTPSLTLVYSKLLKGANNTEIISTIGGEDKAEVFLSEIFHQISEQPNGENGILLNNGDVNFFYVRDVSGILRTIRILWQNDAWEIHAILPHDILNLPIWKEGSQIFSRK